MASTSSYEFRRRQVLREVGTDDWRPVMGMNTIYGSISGPTIMSRSSGRSQEYFILTAEDRNRYALPSQEARRLSEIDLDAAAQSNLHFRVTISVLGILGTIDPANRISPEQTLRELMELRAVTEQRILRGNTSPLTTENLFNGPTFTGLPRLPQSDFIPPRNALPFQNPWRFPGVNLDASQGTFSSHNAPLTELHRTNRTSNHSSAQRQTDFRGQLNDDERNWLEQNSRFAGYIENIAPAHRMNVFQQLMRGAETRAREEAVNPEMFKLVSGRRQNFPLHFDGEISGTLKVPQDNNGDVNTLLHKGDQGNVIYTGALAQRILLATPPGRRGDWKDGGMQVTLTFRDGNIQNVQVSDRPPQNEQNTPSSSAQGRNNRNSDVKPEDPSSSRGARPRAARSQIRSGIPRRGASRS